MSLDKLLGVLKNAEVEITDELKSSITETWNNALKEIKTDTDGLLTQEEVNDIVQKRLARERNTYEAELKELRGKMEKLVDPNQIEEVKTQFEDQINNLEKQRTETIKEYELRLAAIKAGAKDADYVIFQAEKKGLKDQLSVDDKDGLVLVDKDGNPQKDDKGNVKTVASLMDSLKEEMPLHFEESGEPGPRRTPGSTNPLPGVEDEKPGSIGAAMAKGEEGTTDYDPWKTRDE